MGVFSLGPPSTGEAWRIRPVSCLRNRTQRAVTTMKRTTITFPCAAGGVITPVDGRPTLEHLQAAVDGTDIEMVPGFAQLYRGTRRCSGSVAADGARSAGSPRCSRVRRLRKRSARTDLGGIENNESSCYRRTLRHEHGRNLESISATQGGRG